MLINDWYDSGELSWLMINQVVPIVAPCALADMGPSYLQRAGVLKERERYRLVREQGQRFALQDAMVTLQAANKRLVKKW